MGNRHLMASIIILSGALASPLALAGCGGTPGPAAELPTFEWEARPQVPEWREGSGIHWYGTFEQEEVIQESLSSGKPILCYVSRYDKGFETREMEEELLASEVWSALIADHFVAWEINLWEDPALALHVHRGSADALERLSEDIPCVIVLWPSCSEGLCTFNVVDLWDFSRFNFFPASAPVDWDEIEHVHDMVLVPGDPQLQKEFERIRADEGVPLGIARRMFEAGRDYVFFEMGLHLHEDSLGEGRLPPDYCLCFSYLELAAGQAAKGLAEEIAAWGTRGEPAAGETRFDTAMLKGSSRFFCSYMCDPFNFYIPETILGEMCAAANGVDYPVPPEVLFRELFGMVSSSNGILGGGFPAYLDPERAFEEYLAFFENLPRVVLPPPGALKPYYGPRDIVWVNARVLSMWLKLVMLDPSLRDVVLPDGQTTQEFLIRLGPAMVLALEERASAARPGAMPLMHRIYLLDLYNTLYQMSGDSALLDRAGAIAATFSLDAVGEWFDPASAPLYGDLALALHCYGYLAEDQEALALGRAIPEQAPRYMTLHSFSPEAIRLLLAHEVAKAKTIEVCVVSRQDSQDGQELLEAALEGWDPRKVAQLLDPERDAELIERKGLDVTDEAVAYVSVDGVSYPPVSDPDELRELIREVQPDLVDGGEDDDRTLHAGTYGKNLERRVPLQEAA